MTTTVPPTTVPPTTVQPTTVQRCDVLVVGAGPSGLTTALALVRSGVDVLVIEKHPGLSRFPKATGLRPRTMEILRSWGLEDSIRQRAQPTRPAMLVAPTLNAPGQVVDLGLPRAEDVAALSPAALAVCPQDRLERVLLDALLAAGGRCSFSIELLDLDSSDAGVVALVRDRHTRRTGRIEADYVVGADGARSRVREALGIGVNHLGSEGHHLSALFRADLSAVTPPDPYVLTAVVAPGVEGIFVATGEHGRWVYDLEWHPGRGDQLSHWTAERIIQRIQAAAGVPDLAVDLIDLFSWDFGAEVAERQHLGRAFLVGDAAHRTTPRGATGMNTGIADGHNLGWKLAWVLRGWAGDMLLESYAEERAPVGRHNAEASLETGIGRPSGAGLAHDFGVRYASSVVLSSSPLAGARAPHAWVIQGGRRVSTLDLYDGRFTVLAEEPADGWRESVAELARTGLPIRLYGLGSELTDPSGSLRQAYQLQPGRCVLVRPDGHVAWVSAAGEEPGALAVAVALASGRRGVEVV